MDCGTAADCDSWGPGPTSFSQGSAPVRVCCGVWVCHSMPGDADDDWSGAGAKKDASA